MRSVLFLAWAAAAFGQANPPHWVTTWASAQLKAVPQLGFSSAGQGPSAEARALTGFNDQTIRMVVPATLGGSAARVEISNVFGERPLAIGAATLALRQKDSALQPGSARELTWNGQKKFSVPPGASIVTDAVNLPVPQFGEMLVSLYLPGSTGLPTMHPLGLHTTYISPSGDWTARAQMEGAATTSAYYFLAGLHVLAPAGSAALVAFGDSITDGMGSTANANNSWPSVLARRLGGRVAVVNQGIAGNRILQNEAGPNALARFDRDVLGVSGARWLLILEGVNDIGLATSPFSSPAEAIALEQLIAGHKQLIDRAHMAGLKVIGGTLTPYDGAPYYSVKGQQMRDALNQWIRTSGAYDAVVDFDAALVDPAVAKRLRPEFDPGDHLHPNDKGYQAMANAVDPELLK